MGAEYVAQELTELYGVEWRPIGVKPYGKGYLISSERKLFSIRLHRVIQPRVFKNCPKEYIYLYYAGQRKFYQIDELMLCTFPELCQKTNDWKIIEVNGEKTSYEVSRYAEVRRINNHHILKPTLHSDGYLTIRLRHNGRTITDYLHRLVAKAFIPNPCGYDTVNHIDENRQNDNVNNLEWCDKSYNYKYSFDRKKQSPR